MYGYVLNNPVNYLDQYGLIAEAIPWDPWASFPILPIEPQDEILLTFPFLLRGVFIYMQKEEGSEKYATGIACPTKDEGLIVLPLMGEFKPRPPQT